MAAGPLLCNRCYKWSVGVHPAKGAHPCREEECDELVQNTSMLSRLKKLVGR